MAAPNGKWDRMKAARAAAEAAAAEIARRGPVEPPADELARFRKLLEAHRWVFAKTMPQNPHWYSLRKEWANDQDFVEVVRFIRRYGYVERFPDPVKGWPYVFMDIAGHHYWTMGSRCEPGPYGSWPDDEILINRKPLEAQ